MDNPRRSTRQLNPPTRLTYGELGKPSDSFQPVGAGVVVGGATAKQQGVPVQEVQGKIVIERDAIVAQITEAQRQKEVGEKTRENARAFLANFEGTQEENLTEMEVRDLRMARADLNNSNLLIKLRNEDLSKLRADLKRIDSAAIQESSPIQKKTTSKTGSSHSSVVSKSKQVELHSRTEMLELKKTYNSEKRQLRTQLDDLGKVLSRATDEDEKARLKVEIESLQLKLKRLEEDFQEDQEMLREAEELEKDKILAESEEEQCLSSDDDDKSGVKRAENWVDQQNSHQWAAPPHSPVNISLQEDFTNDHGGVDNHLMTDDNSNYGTARDSVFMYPAGAHTQRYQGGVRLPPPLVRYPSATGYHHPSQQVCPPPRHQPQPTGNTVTDLANALRMAFKPEHDWRPEELPKFGGKAEEWPIFYNEFQRTTPSGKVNSSQNAIRLRKALVGLAREAVVGLLNEPNNIERIMEILKQQFGRPEFIIEALIAKAAQAKGPDATKPETFVTYGRAVQHLVETVRSLKEDRYLYDVTLLNQLVKKLPTSFAIEWLSWIEARPHQIKNLSAFAQWVDTKMSLFIQLVKPVIKEDSTGNARNLKSTRGSASINVAATEEVSPKQTKIASEKESCSCCGMKNHRIQRCFKFKKMTAEERIKLVKEKSLCFRCLDGSHIKRDCPSSKICEESECLRDHHTLLHLPDQSVKRKSNGVNTNSEEETKEAIPIPTENPDSTLPSTSSNVKVVQTSQSKTLSIVRIRVKGPKGVKRVYAMLDNGGDTTMIDANLAEELGITGEMMEHKCHVFGGGTTTSVSKNVEFDVAGSFRKARYYTIKGALTFDAMGLPPYSQDAEKAKKKYKYLKPAKLESFTNVQPLVLIGEDHPKVTVHRKFLEGGDDEPVAKRTMLGWVLGGRKLYEKRRSSHINVFSVLDDSNLDKLMQHNFSLEAYGNFPSVSGSVEDRRALEVMKRTTRRISDNKWECALLWRNEDVKLPESRTEAVARLMRNEEKMRRDPCFAKLYHDKIDEYIRKGYATELSPHEAAGTSDKTLYIPHFGVFNVNKPGKIRMVFDAACKFGGVSLNNHLMTGPDMMKLLSAILINFRIHNIAINGDIEDMYHRVFVRKEDRESQRFVWRDLRENSPNNIRDFVMNVLLFGSCCSQSSAIFVKDSNADEFQEDYPEAVRAIKSDFYSDDCLSGAQTVKEAIKLLKEITLVNAAGNFHVKKWLSNSKELIEAIPEQDRAMGLKGFSGKEEIPLERILGLWWNPETDVFTFSANFKKVDPTLLDGRRPTKREMCGLVMSVFDPLGFLANFKIKGLMLLQSTWQAGIQWDEEIPDNIHADWQAWVDRLKDTENVQIPRRYVTDIHLAEDIELHTMVDASEEGTCAISYLRIQLGGEVTLSFMFGKAKVAPLKRQTIPRLELMAAVMWACQADSIVQNLRVKISRRYFWSDSITVLRWIRSETTRYKEFVANRVNRIHLLSKVTEWRWVPTKLNVADQGTRSSSKIDLSANSSWLKGPEFLLEHSDHWPTENVAECRPEEYEEIRKSKIFASCQVAQRTCKAGVLINMEQFSDYVRMVNAQAAVLRAARYWIARTRKEKVTAPWYFFPSSAVGKNEIGSVKFLREHLRTFPDPNVTKKAELILVKKAQWDEFQVEVESLRRSGTVNKGSKLAKLSVYLDEDTIRMKGRIQAASVPPEVNTPAILPSRHYLTELLIQKEHQRKAHQGHTSVLVEIRKRFWILQGRAAVQRVIRRCFKCVDLMGPVEVVVGRHHEKRWIAVFTCMVTRAVHLEIVYGLSTDETMMAFSRFIDSRGRPHHIYSDNGTNFVGAKREMEESWRSVDWGAIMDLDKFSEIKWSFTPPHLPHFGGAWERMVQLVKRILRKTLREKFPKDPTLLTMVKGAENIINDRPLSYASDDPSDPQPLTPNHFLRGFADVGPNIPGEYTENDGAGKAQWRRAQFFMDEFWTRWRNEVLPELARRSKWFQDTEPLKVGDLVLLVDDQAPRDKWSKGVIIKVHPGKDGQVRVVQVRTGDTKDKRGSVFKRGVEKLIRLGVRAENQDTS